jgi:hypothetical protein
MTTLGALYLIRGAQRLFGALKERGVDVSKLP